LRKIERVPQESVFLNTKYKSMSRFFYLSLLFLSFSALQSQIQTPDAFLGYELGSHFSRHHQVVSYFQHLEKNSAQLKLHPYGKTNEGRLLQLAFISSEKNLENIEAIRQAHLQNSGMVSGPKNEDKAIVWLSYNVHGNESSSTEAAMKTAHALITKYNDWLENTVIILDPCINPDGRDRYVNFYNQTKSTPNDTEPFSREHQEGWHNGRTNHYSFDLNRDWAWLTQVESQQRVKLYNQWLPHIHVDFHEQGINSPYYFAPAAEPLHEIITPFQKSFQDVLGKNHAKYFDKEGWFYFTKQRFDLLYPSYGDTYPTYLGAIGMTYEQAGGGVAGLGIKNDENITLTLKDRIEHHYTTGISTVEIAAQNISTLNKNYQLFFDNKDVKYKNFIMQGHPDKLDALHKLLNQHDITSHQLTKNTTVKGYDYQKQGNTTSNFSEQALVVSTKQPKGKMVQVLLEPQTKLNDSLTYDITAWSLPYAYGLEAMATQSDLNISDYTIEKTTTSMLSEALYGYALSYNSFEDSRFLAALLKENIGVRFNETPLTNSGKSWTRGSLFILKGDNQKLPNYLEKLAQLASDFNRKLTPIQTGYSSQGPDLGAGELILIKAPKIAILKNDRTSSYNYGEVWHYFEQALGYPLLQLDENSLTTALNHIDQLIIPDGYYSQWDEANATDQALMDWVKKGGKLIPLAGALNRFANTDSFKLKRKETHEMDTTEMSFGDQSRNEISYITTGSIFEAQIDKSHPISFGLDHYYSLKLDETAYELIQNGNNAFTLSNTAKAISGFIGYQAINKQRKSLLVGEEMMGRGKVVYFVDNVLFRGFWYTGKIAFANALFFL
jgi:hypothetical protein